MKRAFIILLSLAAVAVLVFAVMDFGKTRPLGEVLMEKEAPAACDDMPCSDSLEYVLRSDSLPSERMCPSPTDSLP